MEVYMEPIDFLHEEIDLNQLIPEDELNLGPENN